MRIVFVRHGEPNYELDCLTPLGRVQAEAAAERLREEGIAEIYSSPLGRALETAQAAQKVLELKDIHIMEDMREMWWGSTDGEPLFSNGHPWDIADELARQGWDLARPDWPSHPLFARNKATAEAAKVARCTDEWLASLGYIREGVYYRCARPDDEQYTVALFSHGGSSAAALARIFNLPFPYMCATLHLPFTGITIARFDREPGSISLPRMELVSDGRHIRGLSV
ncbi:MAG: histidine phosphatase family protein [Clostridia bacterium]|nr:histidine phosphatase family protein [Clostridia bacterium]